MKKIFAMLIATVMLFSFMSVSAFAAEIPTDGSTSADVYAKYAEGAKTDTYKVNLSWGSMKFVYSASTEEWDADKHEWKTVNESSWAAESNTANVITITNHSSVDVNADLGFTATANGVEGGTFTCKGNSVASVTIGNALSGTAVTEEVFFMPVGNLIKTDSNTADYVTIGKITVILN